MNSSEPKCTLEKKSFKYSLVNLSIMLSILSRRILIDFYDVHDVPTKT